MLPLSSNGGKAGLDVGEMNHLRIVRQFRDDNESDFSLFAILSVRLCFDSLIIEVTLFRIRLNLTQ